MQKEIQSLLSQIVFQKEVKLKYQDDYLKCSPGSKRWLVVTSRHFLDNCTLHAETSYDTRPACSGRPFSELLGAESQDSHRRGHSIWHHPCPLDLVARPQSKLSHLKSIFLLYPSVVICPNPSWGSHEQTTSKWSSQPANTRPAP